MTELQHQLLSHTERDVAEVEPLTRTGMPVVTRKRQRMASAHTVTLMDEWKGERKSRMRRQRACKVCSIVRRKIGNNANGTSHFCETCSEDSAKLWPSMKRRELTVLSRWCFDTWHDKFDCGRALPCDLSTSIKMCCLKAWSSVHDKHTASEYGSDGEEVARPLN